MSWVVVIPKEGWAPMASHILLTVWHRLFRLFLKKILNLFIYFYFIFFIFFFFWKSKCHTKSRMGAATRAHPLFGVTRTFFWQWPFCMTQPKLSHVQQNMPLRPAHNSSGMTLTMCTQLQPSCIQNLALKKYFCSIWFKQCSQQTSEEACLQAWTCMSINYPSWHYQSLVVFFLSTLLYPC